MAETLKEERYVENRNEARAPPHLNPPETRIALGQLWSRLPAENRRRALIVLGRVAGQQFARPSDRPSHDGDRNLPVPLGKEAGHENR